MRAQLTGLTLATLVLVGCTPDDATTPDPTTTEPTVDEAVDDDAGDGSVAVDGAAAEDDTDAPAATDGAAGSDPGETAARDAAAPEDAAAADGGDPDETTDDDAPGAVDVSIDDFSFTADSVTIDIGDTVTWTHDGRITHNVTATDDSFASDNLGAGDTFSHTFSDVGEFTYVCTLHSQMVATVTVG